MDINTTLLIIAALLPAVILCIYIFKKDRVEKEPIDLLIRLLCLGALICYPAADIENILIGGIDKMFSPFMTFYDGEMVMSDAVYYIYNFIYCFFGVALVEEGMKWIVLRFCTGRNHNFNSFFDGLIYAIFVSLGFAALENVFYVTQYGWYNALMRAILSVPGHMFFAVMMGYYYSCWNILRQAKEEEQRLKEEGYIPADAQEFNYKRNKELSLLVPIILHGTYNFCCRSMSTVLIIAFYIFVMVLYRYCFSKIKKMSSADAYNKTYVQRLIMSKYPHLVNDEQQTEEEEI